jgi:hypothetical protein
MNELFSELRHSRYQLIDIWSKLRLVGLVEKIPSGAGSP